MEKLALFNSLNEHLNMFQFQTLNKYKERVNIGNVCLHARFSFSLRTSLTNK